MSFSGLDDSFLTRTGRRLRARVCGDCAVIVIRVYPYGFCITLSYNLVVVINH
jgi:hypothetical protein